MSENPYAPPQDVDGYEDRSPTSRRERVRGLRIWLWLFSGVIGGLCVLGWFFGILVGILRSDEDSWPVWLNEIAVSMTVLFYLPYLFVVYRMVRALGRTRGKAILYTLLGLMAFSLGEGNCHYLIPFGLFIVTIRLNGLAGEIIGNVDE